MTANRRTVFVIAGCSIITVFVMTLVAYLAVGTYQYPIPSLVGAFGGIISASIVCSILWLVGRFWRWACQN